MTLPPPVNQIIVLVVAGVITAAIINRMQYNRNNSPWIQ